MADALEQLLETMREELQWQRDLAAVLENKLDAMRHYDVSRLESLSISEQRLMQAVHVRAQKRHDACQKATAQLLPERSHETASAGELARVAPEPARAQLLSLTALLREAMEKVQRLNRVNRLSTQRILGHLEHIFKLIAQSGRDIGLYGRAGKKPFVEQYRLVDALA